MSEESRNHPSEDTLFEVAHGIAHRDKGRRVLAHLGECAQCEDSFAAMCRTRERARAEKIPRFAHDAKVSGGRPRWAWLGAAALISALAISIGLPWLMGPNEAPSPYWLGTNFESAQMRSHDTSVPEGLPEALEFYRSEDTAAAISALRELELDDGWSDLRDVYLAGALAHAGQFDELEPLLEDLRIESLPYRYRQAARWYRYLMLEGTGRESAAREQLDSLTKDDGPIGKLARRELERRNRS